jgi:hypothetical protein
LRDQGRLRVFEKRVLRSIFGPMRDEITQECRKPYIEELNDLYSTTTVQMIESRRNRWLRHIARMGESGSVYRFWWGHLREGENLEDPGVDGRIY